MKMQCKESFKWRWKFRQDTLFLEILPLYNLKKCFPYTFQLSSYYNYIIICKICQRTISFHFLHFSTNITCLQITLAYFNITYIHFLHIFFIFFVDYSDSENCWTSNQSVCIDSTFQFSSQLSTLTTTESCLTSLFFSILCIIRFIQVYK